ncbi:uncharacterized protein LOC141665288 [Apium graveolens]|uniref:uncharacterized protein LOC141665288 n=1 Tax=Apium graveolens TaxID=4045 RepID=UPI003D795B6A
MESQVLLKQGAVRRVGKGTEIDIVKDHWLPVHEPYIQIVYEALQGKTVDSLMSLDHPGWDIDLIHDIFEDRDIQLILSIPLNTTEVDTWFWNKEKMGQYTVKSSYALLQEDRNASHEADAEWWRRMWNLKVPLRVQHFIWRAVRNVLPTKDQLTMKRVPVIEYCPVCNESKETVYHLLVSCPFTGLCWKELNITVHNNDLNCFSTWISAASQQYSTRKYQEIIMMCWMIWNNRNEMYGTRRDQSFQKYASWQN